MDNKICPGCGSEYELTEHHAGMRDKGSIKCEVCKEEFVSWNGSNWYSATLVKRGRTPKPKSRPS